MSDAAPSAPGAAAPAAGPAATATGEPSAPQAAAPAARTIKPLPPAPKLPGVVEDGPVDASSPEAVAARARDAQGRFVAGEPKGDQTVVKPQPRAVDPTDVIDPPNTPTKFKFGDEEFADQAAAEAEYKSRLRHQKSAQQAAAQHEARLIKAAESARGWHSEAQRLQAELDALRAAAPEPAKPEPVAKPGIDWDLYAEISKVAAETGEPWKAQQWLQEQVDAQRRADFESWRESFEAPYREREAAAAEQAQLAQTAETLVDSMAAHENPDGSPTFPEFRDGDTAREVGHLWQSLGLNPRIALTPGGAVAAVALYRLARGMDPATVAASMPAAPAAPAAPPSPDPAALAAAGLDDGRPLLPSTANRRETDPGVARLVAGLKNHQLIRPGLGFEA